jgi:hypothetical protein
MKDPRFKTGQHVKVIRMSGSDPEIDRLLGALEGKRGVVESYFCIGRDEMPDRIKMFVYPDFVYSYNIRLDDGDILRGIPEAVLVNDDR